MNELIDLYDSGMIYTQYIETGDNEAKQKHLHYLHKVEFSKEDRQKILKIKNSDRLLVFCSIMCNDCRITLAVLENIRQINPLIEYRIIDRERNRELMQSLSGEQRIPLVVQIQENDPQVVLNEFPDQLKSLMKNSNDEEKDNLKIKFRKGLYNEQMVNQILSFIA